MRLAILACVTAMGLFACGGTIGQSDDGGNDSGTGVDVVVDDVATDASVGYPADHAPLPLVDYGTNGRVIANPKIVTVTFSGDDPNLVARLQQFGDTITATPWWKTGTSEYCEQPNNAPCVGPGTGGGHVVITDAPAANYTDSSGGGASTIHDFIKQYMASSVVGDGGTDASDDGGEGGTASDGGTLSQLPIPDENTLYAIYFPASVSIDLDPGTSQEATSCNGFGAYHNTLLLPNKNNLQIPVAYAIIPRCSTNEAVTTLSASHEFAEAATDPDIGYNQTLTYYMTTDQAWPLADQGGEIGDLCAGFGSKKSNYVESTFTVQRLWSNASAKASHDPCVPIPSGEVYFNAAPRPIKGLQDHIILPKMGASVVVDLDAFSDGPTGDWTVSAIDYATFMGGSAVLSFSFDATTANNGTHLQLTVTSAKAITTGYDLFVIVSTQGQSPNQVRHSWPVLVTTN